MAEEIERKFLVKNSNWKEFCSSKKQIKQGYLNSNKERTVRIRVTDDIGFITIKGKSENITRPEFEYEIPYNDAIELLKLCELSIIDKTRYLVKHDSLTWEIDVFEGDNKGLIVAEVELESENQEFKKPEWLGEEVSGDIRYYNSNLIKNPFSNWS